MKLDDFRYMVRGQIIKSLNISEASLLTSIERKGVKQNRALLLLHGFSSSPAVYRRMLPLLTMYDTVSCPALPGHGKSIDEFSKARADDWIECAMHACEKLTNSHQQTDVMGLSLGGLLAYHVSHYFQLNHLYLLAPALSLKMPLSLYLAVTKLLYNLGVRRIPNRAGSLCSNAHPELAYRQLPLSVIIQILTLIKTFQPRAPSCPIDVFLGRHDSVINSPKVAAHFITTPNAHIHWLEHSAHVLPLDNDMLKIITCIEENSRD